MGTIASLNRSIQAIDYNRIVVQSIDQTKDAAAQLNRDDLSVGLLATSNPITPRYSPVYAKRKGITTPNLYATGDFYKGIFVKVEDKQMVFDSTDIKGAALEHRYSKFIYGLTQDAKTAYSLGTLKPVLIANLKNAIGL